MSEQEETFVTVAEAAKALGLSDRQARRRAAVLDMTGRTRTHDRTRLVTVADMAAVRPADAPKKGTVEENAVKTPRPDDRTDALGHDRTPRPDATATRPDLSAELEKALEALRQERERAAVLEAQKQGLEAKAELLERELGDWKGQAREALRALQQAQEETRAARLLPSGRGPGLIASQETTGSPESSPSVPSGVSAPLAQRKGFFERIRRWW